MADDKKEGAEKKCGKCGVDLICVKITKSYQGKTETKLQWQTKSIRRAHFKYAGPNNWNCITPEDVVAASMEQPKEEPKPAPTPEPKKEVDTTIRVNDPFQESELIVRWAKGRAYKMVYEEVTDINNLSPQEKSGLGQKEGMLTRALVDTTIELMKINGIKSEYAK